jgi:hypothetical protein
VSTNAPNRKRESRSRIAADDFPKIACSGRPEKKAAKIGSGTSLWPVLSLKIVEAIHPTLNDSFQAAEKLPPYSTHPKKEESC